MTIIEKSIAVLTIALLTTAPAAPAAESFVARFQPGVHYIELRTPQSVETGDKIELREFFWYGCPHCYVLEAPLAAYLKKLPANVKFVRTPGVSPNWLPQAQAFYTFEIMGVTDKLHAPLFEAWHVKNERPKNVGAFAAFAARHGVDAGKFRQTFNSFAVRTRLERARQQNVGYMVDGVPMLAIDGRYLTSPSIAGRQERNEAKRVQLTLEVTDFLIQKAARERKTSSAR